MNCRTSVLVALLSKNGWTRFGERHGHEVWVGPNGEIARIPLVSEIHIDLVEELLLDVMGLSPWEVDYWLGQSKII